MAVNCKKKQKESLYLRTFRRKSISAAVLLLLIWKMWKVLPMLIEIMLREYFSRK